MTLGLSGRVAVVTGASAGIGRSVAITLAREGVKVMICARSEERLREAANEMQELGAEVLDVVVDVTRKESVASAIAQTAKRFGAVDILVNNVGGAGKFAGFRELEDDDWINAYKLNFLSGVYFINSTLPLLRKSEAGRIINISSLSGVQPGTYNPHYTSSKAAMINLSKYLANDLASENILVNVVCPGPTHSLSWEQNIRRIAESQGRQLAEVRKQIELEEIKKIPLGRIGEGEDVAGMVVYLASDAARWITGSCFHVDGGKLRSAF